MKKLLVLFVAMLLATNAFALVESNEAGPKHTTLCYVTDMSDLVSGDAVVLQTSSPTYYGAEVTSSTTAGLPIYGVVLGDPSLAKCRDGGWIRVQTYGYCPIVKLASYGAVTANSATGMSLVTSTESKRATSASEELSSHNTIIVTGDTGGFALESLKGLGPTVATGAGQTFKAFLTW